MATWDPVSYVADVVGSARNSISYHRGAASFFDFTAGVLEQGERSRAIAKYIDAERDAAARYIGRVEQTPFCVLVPLERVGGHPDSWASATNELESAIANEMGISFRRFHDGFVSQYDSFVRCHREVATPRQQAHTGVNEMCRCAFACTVLAKVAEEHPILRGALFSGGGVTAALQGHVWSTGVPGAPLQEGDSPFVRIASLGTGGIGVLCHTVLQQPSLHTKVAVSLLGNGNITVLSAFLLALEYCESNEDVISALKHFVTSSTEADSFIYAEPQGVVVESSDSTPSTGDVARDSTQLLNMSTHLMKAVKESNSADSFHLLENSFDSSLHRSVAQVIAALPHYNVVVSVLTEKLQALSALQESFQFCGTGHQFGCVHLQQCSPLYNYIFANGATCVLSFVDEETAAKFAEGGLCQWAARDALVSVGTENGSYALPSALSNADIHYLFSTENTITVGDCASVFGALHSVGSGALTAFCGACTTKLSPLQWCIAPLLCTSVHRVYGGVGFVGASCSLSSNFPPTIAVTASYESCGDWLEESSVDPNFCVVFLDHDYKAFSGGTCGQVLDALPFPVSVVRDLPLSAVAWKLRCRLLRVDHYERASCVSIVMAVTQVYKGTENVLLRVLSS